MRPQALLPLLSVGAAAFEFQLPFSIPFLSSSSSPPSAPLLAPAPDPPAARVDNRIAIIGAGAAGSSAAFWLAKARERTGLDLQVDVYERSGYIGGRSTTVHPHDDPALDPVELGASIFVKANKNLWRASEEFGLERIDFNEDKSVLGYWNGEEFLLTMGGKSFYSDWWSSLKILWRYGYSAPSKTSAIVDALVSEYLALYKADAPRFNNLTSLVETLGWTGIISRTAAEYLDVQAVNPKWTRELVDGMTRVNYGQNVDSIHGLEGLISLATTGATSIKGGNFQMFEGFIARSNATVHLNTTVESITRPKHGGPWVVRTSTDEQHYRAVIIAAPFHTSGIALSPASLAAQIPPQAYVHLHVTLLSTTAETARAEYFGVKGGVPTQVLTTWDAVRERGARARAPEFNSLTFHGPVQYPNGTARSGVAEHVVKIFSAERLSDEWLERAVGQVQWVYRKEWDAYPVLPPAPSFSPLKLDRGLFYVNSFEPFISTMETETISSRNIVDLLLREEFDAGICGKSARGAESAEPAQETVIEEEDKKDTDDFVLGWDC